MLRGENYPYPGKVTIITFPVPNDQPSMTFFFYITFTFIILLQSQGFNKQVCSINIWH